MFLRHFEAKRVGDEISLGFLLINDERQTRAPLKGKLWRTFQGNAAGVKRNAKKRGESDELDQAA